MVFTTSYYPLCSIAQVVIAMRDEYYSDPNCLVISYALPEEFKATGISLNLDYNPIKQTLVRIEWRWLNNKTAVFFQRRRFQ